MTMQERIKQIRKENNLSQSAFGEKIGISSSQIACYENGIREITERSINSICKEFNINKDWFLTGEGDMLNVPIEDERLVEALMKIQESGNEKLKSTIEKMMELDEKYIDIILNLVDTILQDKK